MDINRTQTENAQLFYDFLTSGKLYHQKLTALNPNPVVYRKGQTEPKDKYILNVDIDSLHTVPSVRTLKQAIFSQTELTGIASHRKDIDETIRIVLPVQSHTSCTNPYFVPLVTMTTQEYNDIQKLFGYQLECFVPENEFIISD